MTPIKKRNMGLQVLWYILTCGLYGIYWFYATTREISERLGRKDEIMVWTILMGLPPLCLYSMYKHGELYEIFTDKAVERWVIFLLWIVFSPAVWFIVQRKLNDLAEKSAGSDTPAIA